MSAGGRAPSKLASSLVLGGRILLLLAAIASVVTALAIARRDGPRRPGAAPPYACPMHPEATGYSATVCPICGMALELVRPNPTSPMGSMMAETFSVAPTSQSRLFYDVMFARARPIARDMQAPAWIDKRGEGMAVFYNDEIALLEPREEGTFQTSGGAGAPAFRIRVIQKPAASGAPATAATSAVRFTVTEASSPPTGVVGWIKLAPRTRQMLAVPASAIVQSPAGPYVLVASVDRHTFARRPVQIGRVLYGYAPILDGVREGERVVAMNTFFLDAERRWRSRSDVTGDLREAPP